MIGPRTRSESAALDFLVAADRFHDDLFLDRQRLIGLALRFGYFAAVVGELADDAGVRGNLAAYCTMVAHRAARMETCLAAVVEFGADADVQDLRLHVADGETVARSLHAGLVERRGGCLRDEVNLIDILGRPAPAENRPAVVWSAADSASASASARRVIGLAVLVLPPAHRARFHEEWMALVVDEAWFRQLHFSCGLLIGAWSVRQALMEAGPVADVAGADEE